MGNKVETKPVENTTKKTFTSPLTAILLWQVFDRSTNSFLVVASDAQNILVKADTENPLNHHFKLAYYVQITITLYSYFTTFVLLYIHSHSKFFVFEKSI